MANRLMKRLLYRNKPAQIVQYAFVAFLKWLLNLVRTDTAIIAGKFIGDILYLLDYRHRKVALDNLRRAMGHEVSEQRLRAIARGVYEHIGISVAEMMTSQKIIRERGIERVVRLWNRESVDEALAKGKGAVVALAHLGNWELAAQAVVLLGYRLTSVARPVENPYLDRILNGFRRSRGQVILFKKNALRHMARALKENSLVAILCDQDAKKHGIFVDFFGRKSSTVRSPAVIAIKYNVPIFLVNVYRDERKQCFHHIEISDPILPEDVAGAEDPVARLTAIYTARIEGFIRRHPEQWLWLHRRWKTRPEDVEKGSAAPANEATV